MPESGMLFLENPRQIARPITAIVPIGEDKQ